MAAVIISPSARFMRPRPCHNTRGHESGSFQLCCGFTLAWRSQSYSEVGICAYASRWGSLSSSTYQTRAVCSALTASTADASLTILFAAIEAEIDLVRLPDGRIQRIETHKKRSTRSSTLTDQLAGSDAVRSPRTRLASAGAHGDTLCRRVLPTV